jgi:Polyketide cyclase / dehydrase and lipid transport
MKIALILAAALILLIAAVIVTGSLLPKHHIASRAAAFRATPAQLFALISGSQSWRPDVLTSVIDTDATGRQILRESTRDGNKMTYAVTANPPHSLTRTIVGTRLPFDGSWTYTLEPISSGTKVRITEDANIYNPVFRFMSRFILGYTGSMDKYLQALGAATGQRQIEITD